ncbi:unnamed protein product [Didymodactylos carnosus]|uniref:Uncharacterized protein n=1 Tax=Didymodactylos carnosus TaxID=1234261 RepID=A0A815PST1_9BILA|nr:unnamed protein product [Didymodactylos carnosus]CAF1452642.1 unnamed protein product [Didymodactylos carnosus]CAF4056223.1 unnamed protein product [Didymodactylos carnosus]CAF4325467.1 unnamed protein product [Didymodactylos carnosus]
MFRQRSANTVQCECDARTDTTVPVMVKGFGTIDECGVGLINTCSCTHAAMTGCSAKCEKTVQEWVKAKCPGALFGVHRGLIMSYYHGDCEKGYGTVRYVCP